MIEKLKTINPYDETEIDMDTNSVGGLVYENTPLVQKINEFVNVVNGLQTKVNKLASNINFVKPEVKETFVCPEQYKWIGKLCKFWDNDEDVFNYAILKEINEYSNYPYVKPNRNVFKHCEPVKPDDDIIYKGE